MTSARVSRTRCANDCALLTERFQVAIHHETSEELVNALVVTKGGPNLAEHRDADGKRQRIVVDRAERASEN